MFSFKSKSNRLTKAGRLFVAVCVCLTAIQLPVQGHAQAQGVPSLHTPAILAGITLYPKNPLQIDFIVDAGDDNLDDIELREESNKLIRYFMATLTIPESEMWVNLSPYERNRIMADGLGETVLGKDMLAQDYVLKQLSASVMHPENEIGKKFWDRVYKNTYERFGETEITADIFNKIWIVPEKAVVYSNGNNIFVADSSLKVMLEEDYLALEHHDRGLDDQAGQSSMNAGMNAGMNGEIKKLMKEVILPEIERHVNEGRDFAILRQIYHSMILATWYKKNLRQSLLGKIYVNQSKVKGVDLTDKGIKHKIYNQYLDIFKKGAFDFIREEYDPIAQEIIPRRYFSGGIDVVDLEEDSMAAVDEVEPGSWLDQRENAGSQKIRIAAGLKFNGSPDEVREWNAHRFARKEDAQLRDGGRGGILKKLLQAAVMLGILASPLSFLSAAPQEESRDEGTATVLTLDDEAVQERVRILSLDLYNENDLTRLSASEQFDDDQFEGSPDAILVLEMGAQDVNPAVRKASLRALARIGVGNSTAVRIATNALTDSDPLVREQAAAALVHIATQYNKNTSRALMKAADKKEIERLAYRALGQTAKGDQEVTDFLISRLERVNKRLKKYHWNEREDQRRHEMLNAGGALQDIARSLTKIAFGSSRALTALAELVEDDQHYFGDDYLEIMEGYPVEGVDNQQAVLALVRTYNKSWGEFDEDKREGVVKTISRIGGGSPHALSLLSKALVDPVPRVRKQAAEGMLIFNFEGLDKRKALEALIQAALTVDSRSVSEELARDSIVLSLRHLGYKDHYVKDQLIQEIKDPRGPRLLSRAIETLGLIAKRGDREAVSLLTKHLEADTAQVKYSLYDALEKVVNYNNENILDILEKKYRDHLESQKHDHYEREVYLYTIAALSRNNEKSFQFMDFAIENDSGNRRTAKKLVSEMQSRDNLVSITKDDLMTIDNLKDVLDPPQEILDVERAVRIYKFAQSNVLVFDFRTLWEQAKALDRLAVFVEKPGYQDRVLTDTELELLKKALNKGYIYDGHDYMGEKIAEFFNLAEKQGIDLNEDELRFRQLLIDLKMLTYSEEEGYKAVADSAIISLTQDADLDWREAVLLHESSHALYFTNPEYRAKVIEAYNNLNEDEQRLVKLFLAYKGYNIADQELVYTEFAAYFQDGRTLVDLLDYEYSSNFGESIEDDRKRQVWNELRGIYEVDGEKYIFRGQVEAKMRDEVLDSVEKTSSGLQALFLNHMNHDFRRVDKKPDGNQDPAPMELTSRVSKKTGGIAIGRWYSYPFEGDSEVDELKDFIRNTTHPSFEFSDMKRRVLSHLHGFRSGDKVRIIRENDRLAIIELDEDGNIPKDLVGKMGALREALEERPHGNKFDENSLDVGDETFVYRNGNISSNFYPSVHQSLDGPQWQNDFLLSPEKIETGEVNLNNVFEKLYVGIRFKDEDDTIKYFVIHKNDDGKVSIPELGVDDLPEGRNDFEGIHVIRKGTVLTLQPRRGVHYAFFSYEAFEPSQQKGIEKVEIIEKKEPPKEEERIQIKDVPFIDRESLKQRKLFIFEEGSIIKLVEPEGEKSEKPEESKELGEPKVEKANQDDAQKDKKNKTDSADVGGIDLNANNLDMEFKGAQIKLETPHNLHNIEVDLIDGLTPVIIHVTPIENFPFLLGKEMSQDDFTPLTY